MQPKPSIFASAQQPALAKAGVRILLRADSGFAREALMAWCAALADAGDDPRDLLDAAVGL